MNYKDPTNNGLYGEGAYCRFCKESEWGPDHMEETPDGDPICPNCRMKCDYCEQYFLHTEMTCVPDGVACSDCMFHHDLKPLDEFGLFDTLISCLS